MCNNVGKVKALNWTDLKHRLHHQLTVGDVVKISDYQGGVYLSYGCSGEVRYFKLDVELDELMAEIISSRTSDELAVERAVTGK